MDAAIITLLLTLSYYARGNKPRRFYERSKRAVRSFRPTPVPTYKSVRHSLRFYKFYTEAIIKKAWNEFLRY